MFIYSVAIFIGIKRSHAKQGNRKAGKSSETRICERHIKDNKYINIHCSCELELSWPPGRTVAHVWVYERLLFMRHQKYVRVCVCVGIGENYCGWRARGVANFHLDDLFASAACSSTCWQQQTAHIKDCYRLVCFTTHHSPHNGHTIQSASELAASTHKEILIFWLCCHWELLHAYADDWDGYGDGQTDGDCM